MGVMEEMADQAYRETASVEGEILGTPARIVYAMRNLRSRLPCSTAIAQRLIDAAVERAKNRETNQ